MSAGTWRRWTILSAGVMGALAFVGCRNRADDCEQTLTCSDGGAGATGSPGTAGASGAPGVTPPTFCDPGASDCDGALAVYLSPLGSDEGAGSQEQPVKTLARAVELALEREQPVYACSDEGAYDQALDLDETHSGVAIFGGFGCAGFSRVEQPAHFKAGASGHRITDVDGVLLGDVRLQAASASGAGQSSVSLLVARSQGVRLVRSELVAGEGAPGEAGAGFVAAAGRGADGNPGQNACVAEAAEVSTGGQQVTTSCGGIMTASVGGKGGPGGGGLLPGGGGDGAAGEPDSLPGGTAGEGQGASACSNGGNGAPGANGPHGAGATTFGQLGAEGYAPSRGEAGEPGGVGQGGGGGGGAQKPSSCATGASGGSGGGGGCPGAAADGGQSGGGSFGLLSFQSAVELEDVSIEVAEGGAGGAGGDGQVGGSGGQPGPAGEAGAVGDASDACTGGKGGKGGTGGSGGGGAGGPSLGIAYVGEAPTQSGIDVELPASGAPGGAGGNLNESAVGAPGVVSEVQEL